MRDLTLSTKHATLTASPTNGRYMRDYFSVGRPLLIRNAFSLDERCRLAASEQQVAARDN